MSTTIRLSCWWRWTWVVGQSSYRGRSWRRVFSSKLVALFLVSRSHSCQQHLDRSLCRSRNGNGNGRYAEIDIKGFFQIRLISTLLKTKYFCFRLKVKKYAWAMTKETVAIFRPSTFALYIQWISQQLIFYLTAINLHDRCPSPISASKVSHMTENRNWLRV